VNGTAKRTADGLIEIYLRVSPAELQQWRGQSIVTSSETDIGESAEPTTPKYCCTCKNGDQKTIKADGDIAAFFKCLDRCGSEFSLSSGKCK